jgi:CYTH domain-containing protein
VSPEFRSKYVWVERERRFLLAEPPDRGRVSGRVRIVDRYFPGTRLRLREMVDDGPGGSVVRKRTQKVPDARLITNIYLSDSEYELLSRLPGQALRKTRLRVPPLGVDVFDPPLSHLVLAEAEFSSEQELSGFVPPACVVAEVTDDERFTGGRLARTTTEELRSWLAEFGLPRLA